MFEKILLAVDGSDHSNKATTAAAELARNSDGEVYVLHVREVGVKAPMETPSDAIELVNGVVEELRRSGAKADGTATSARTEQAAPAIVDAAKSLDSGVIVMGTRGLSDFSALVIGSMAHKVLHHAASPVLLVR